MPKANAILTAVFNTPAKPAVPVLSTGAAGTLIAEWDQALNAVSYEVWYGKTDSQTDTGNKKLPVIPGGANETVKQTIDSLEKGALYYVWIRGLGPLGEQGDYSNPANMITLLDTPSLNEPTPVDFRRLDLSWSPVEGALSYEVRYTTNLNTGDPGAAGLTSLIVTGATVTTLAEPVIDPNLTYKFWVQARNGAGGVSLWSEPREKRAGRPGIIVEYDIEAVNISVDPPGSIIIYQTGDNATDRPKTVEISTSPVSGAAITWYVGGKTAAQFVARYPGAVAINGNTLMVNAAMLPQAIYNVRILMNRGGQLFNSDDIPVDVRQ
jgi:hypothetical protein